MDLKFLETLKKVIVTEAQRLAGETEITQGAIIVRYEILDDNVSNELELSQFCPAIVCPDSLVKKHKDTPCLVGDKTEKNYSEIAEQRIESARETFFGACNRSDHSLPASLKDYKSSKPPKGWLGEDWDTRGGGIYIPIRIPCHKGSETDWGNYDIGIGLAVSSDAEHHDDDIINDLLPTVYCICKENNLLLPEAFRQGNGD